MLTCVNFVDENIFVKILLNIGFLMIFKLLSQTWDLFQQQHKMSSYVLCNIKYIQLSIIAPL